MRFVVWYFLSIIVFPISLLLGCDYLMNKEWVGDNYQTILFLLNSTIAFGAGGYSLSVSGLLIVDKIFKGI